MVGGAALLADGIITPPISITSAIEGLKKIPALGIEAVSNTHLRAHVTVLDLVCRLLLEKHNEPSASLQ